MFLCQVLLQNVKHSGMSFAPLSFLVPRWLREPHTRRRVLGHRADGVGGVELGSARQATLWTREARWERGERAGEAGRVAGGAASAGVNVWRGTDAEKNDLPKARPHEQNDSIESIEQKLQRGCQPPFICKWGLGSIMQIKQIRGVKSEQNEQNEQSE